MQTHEDGPGRPAGSITRLIGGLRAGDPAAARGLWDHYFEPLVRLAEGRLRGVRGGAASAEDVAVEAMRQLCEKLARPGVDERFPELRTRANLWKLLVCFTTREAYDHVAKELRRARVVSGESALGEAGLQAVPDRKAEVELGAAVRDLLGLLPDDELRDLALRRMEGQTREEIARSLNWSTAKVDRRLKVLRSYWKEWARTDEAR
jgi:DNA-directed RNA polymerase specialized sigma24 family protein